VLGCKLAHCLQNRRLGNVLEIAIGSRFPPCRHIQIDSLCQRCAGVMRCGTMRHCVHRSRYAYGQQLDQLALLHCQQRGEQCGTVLGQLVTPYLLQFAQGHGGGGFRPIRGDTVQPVLHGWPDAYRQIMALTAL